MEKEEKQKKELYYNDFYNESILNDSLNTQTEFVSKPLFSELSKHPVLARITARLETNDHDGYCSDGECSYKSKLVKVNAILPEEYATLCPEIGTSIFYKTWFNYNWTKHLPMPKINIYGSRYCSYKKINGVGRHEYRYTIEDVTVIENKFYKKTSERGYLLVERISLHDGLHAVVDTFAEAEKIAREKNCKIYDLDNLKHVPIKK
jgi:hypothetical protein